MANYRSDQRQDGRFVHGGKATLNGHRLGWWERRQFTRSNTDIPYTITTKYVGRPDLLAYDTYGRANLQWFILQYNNVSDINVEFVEGALVMLPTPQRLFGELLSSIAR